MKNRLKKKNQLRARAKVRVRKKISGTEEKPRLSVFRSCKHMYAQVIDDANGVTICSASTIEKDGKSFAKNMEQAKFVGETVATRLQEKGISSVVFDRGGRPYHGVIKHLADTAREKGLKF